jgi:acetyl-CoA acetyltransferase
MPEPVIAGYGETPFHKEKDEHWHPLEYLATAVDKALTDSNVPKEEVDGLSFSSASLHRENVTNIAQYMGIDGRWLNASAHGGADAVCGIVRAADAIRQEKAEAVLVVCVDSSTPQGHMDRMDSYSWGNYNYMRPFGFGGANGIMALIQKRYMHEHNLTREQLGEISVTQREHARRNPKAIFQGPMTKNKYLNSRPITEPIHLYDCVLPCGGGGSVLLTTKKKAESTGSEYLHILGSDEYHNPKPLEAFTLSERNRGLSCHTTLEQANIEPEDLDTVELYDNYPIYVALQLEDLGFCEEGEVGEFLNETDLSITGDVPLNTGGGQLSCGQPGRAGGMLVAIEAVRQLRGEGGERQVEDCSTAIATGEGMMSYGGGVSTSSVVLSTAPEVAR